jgi:hypothetical protein
MDDLEPQLKSMGCELSASEITNLSYSLVSVGPSGRGGTGSFISSSGLIITNHHVALDAVRRASSVENDFLQQGFVSRKLEDELQGPDYEVWITRKTEDVSAQVLSACTDPNMEPLERANTLRKRQRELVAAKEKELGGGENMRCKISEMFPNKSYVLFTHERLRDVRIVYVPPMCLGNFGGETDNFEWPRHTADFTLLRAYVAPDGTAAQYSKDNVPFKPDVHIRVQPNGVAENDFVFLLGFPGFTMRYAPASRLAFSQETAVPHTVSDFGRKLALVKAFSEGDRDVALKLMRYRKSLANELKRSGGKLLMMRKLKLVEERSLEEARLVEALPHAKPVLDEIAALYGKWASSFRSTEALAALRGGRFAGSAALSVTSALTTAKVEAGKPDAEREDACRERNREYTAQALAKQLCDCHLPFERQIVLNAIHDALDIVCAPVAVGGASDLLAALYPGGSLFDTVTHRCTDESRLESTGSGTEDTSEDSR